MVHLYDVIKGTIVTKAFHIMCLSLVTVRMVIITVSRVLNLHTSYR